MMFLGVLGDERVRRSLSPAMHNPALARAGLAGCYAAFPVAPAELATAVAGLKALKIAGLNVTVPHKRAIIPLLDELAGDAAWLKAVNTVVNQGGRLVGHNTDAIGFLTALEHAGLAPAGKRALVLGTGGAARAAAGALTRAGAARVGVAGRRREAAGELTRQLGGLPLTLAEAAASGEPVELLVNATSVSAAAEGPELAALAPRIVAGARPKLVLDLNYGPGRKLWAGLAREAGAAFQDGLVMLAAQARASFALWTGREEPLAGFLASLGVAS